ncbi:MAG: type I-C CRISPR-associated endonuclease Cas1 [Dechloromonas sp.]|uniref:CRISPR-associated endonuclease Cas1 n=1 Tax=Candidatus Dechloromonas phosphorivorans TaxID=2899244 RepID=A0A9D7QGU6_9RHOO|nr:type I-C CRISPR-associated endonuclease Cas1 [Candidatus Dechloromonas phosphorivorans]
MQLLNTLYVTTPESYLHLDNNTLRIEVGQETRLRVPLHHLGAVVCFGYVSVSLPLMHRLADDGISLVLLDTHGRFKARLEGGVSGNVLLRQAQHRLALDPAFALGIARNCIAGKVRNCRQVLLRGSREAKGAADAAALSRGAADLAATLRALPDAGDADALRGLEGEAARQYFAALNNLVRASARESFRMDGRSRRPPRDRINALLSFVYSMLMNDCRSAVEAAGLDPQVGFLHVVRPGRAALALDLMEEFRSFADRLVLSLINRGQIGPSDFVEREGGAVLLEGDARKAVVVAYQERKQENLSHPLLSEAVPFGLLPHIQARLLARTLRGDTAEYLPYLVH